MTSTGAARAVAVAFLVAGALLRFSQAANPYERQSLDERAYGEVALALAEEGRYGSERQEDPWHWPPGAPALFAAAHLLSPDPASTETRDIPAAYPAQALVGTATIVVAWLLARTLAGEWAGAVAAGAVALYPPLVWFTGEQLSETLGAAVSATAVLALAWAWRRPGRGGWLPAGAALGAAILVRADLLPVAFLAAATVTLLEWWRDRGRKEPGRHLPTRWRAVRSGALAGGLFLLGTLAVLAPWSMLASRANDGFTPVTTGGSSSLFVGTYLPGGGTTPGLKEALVPRLDLPEPYRDLDPQRVPAELVLDTVAARHPHLDRDAALWQEARANLVRYGLGDPLAFLGMMLDKVWLLWGRPALSGAMTATWTATAAHAVLVPLALAGVAIAVPRRRCAVAVVVAVMVLGFTGLHAVAVALPRYALTLMPALFAVGAAGWLGASRSPQDAGGAGASSQISGSGGASRSVTR